MISLINTEENNKTMRILFFFISVLLMVEVANGQINFETIRAKWKQKKYDDVISLGTQYRETLQGKAIPALDYMILSSICLISSPRSEPCTDVQGILKDYYIGLPKGDYQLMETGFNRICQQNSDPDFSISDKLPTRQYAHVQRSSYTTSKFKTYVLISESLKKQGVFYKMDKNEIRNIVEALIDEKSSVQKLTDTLINSYIKRRITKHDTLNIKKAMSRFGANSKYWASDNFLVITSKANKINPKEVATNMEKVVNFYKSAYEMATPDEYIVVYLVQDYKNVQPYIQKLYFNKISFNPLGFSNFYDNSMVAWIYDGSMVGTLKHELVHLLIRSSFNFVPDWFEEGLASLYEESVFDTSSHLQGKDNWRGILLKKTTLNYGLSDLFANREVNFNTYDLIALREKYKQQIGKGSYNEEWLRDLYRDHRLELDEVLTAFFKNRAALYKDALARYFLLYLQDSKKLDKMYQALLQRDKSVMNVARYQTLESVTLKVCEKSSISDLQMDFSGWLNDIYLSK